MLLHASEVTSQIIFSCKCLHSRLTINSLRRSQFADLLRLDACIRPKNVPIRIYVVIKLKVHFAANALDHIVPNCKRTQDQFLICRLFFLYCLCWGGIRDFICFFIFRLYSWLRCYFVGSFCSINRTSSEGFLNFLDTFFSRGASKLTRCALAGRLIISTIGGVCYYIEWRVV